MRKTYAVNGLIEWNIQVPTSSRAMPYVMVEFTGGKITGYGISPATHSTEDPLLQKMIENTHWFKTGKIYLVRR